MPREPKAYLHDMRKAASLVAEFTEGLDFDTYAGDAMVRAASAIIPSSVAASCAAAASPAASMTSTRAGSNAPGSARDRGSTPGRSRWTRRAPASSSR